MLYKKSEMSTVNFIMHMHINLIMTLLPKSHLYINSFIK